jgi:hypothetical protein
MSRRGRLECPVKPDAVDLLRSSERRHRANAGPAMRESLAILVCHKVPFSSSGLVRRTDRREFTNRMLIGGLQTHGI